MSGKKDNHYTAKDGDGTIGKMHSGKRRGRHNLDENPESMNAYGASQVASAFSPQKTSAHNIIYPDSNNTRSKAAIQNNTNFTGISIRRNQS
jgi:hypothetical protein